ncbi:MAG: GspH/FimT family pseudopilin [Undibacterium umbellatum]|uniref:GspH/FimT family pseudopilin n=1 Tax=Undibacterium umbellatum TaxID=2762300 RepID=UPI003BB4D539
MNMQKSNPQHSQRGFTMLEVLIVVAIVGIISSIALPNYRAFIVKSRSVTNAGLLHSAITQAKSIALTSQAVTICKSENPDAPTPTCSTVVSNGSANTGWGSGWIVFQDRNANNDYDSGDTLIRVQPALLLEVAAGSIVPVPPSQSITLGSGAGGSPPGAAMYFYVKPPNSYMGPPYDRYVCLSSIREISVVKSLPCPT